MKIQPFKFYEKKKMILLYTKYRMNKSSPDCQECPKKIHTRWTFDHLNYLPGVPQKSCRFILLMVPVNATFSWTPGSFLRHNSFMSRLQKFTKLNFTWYKACFNFFFPSNTYSWSNVKLFLMMYQCLPIGFIYHQGKGIYPKF